MLKTYASFVKLEHTFFTLPLLFAGALLGARGVPSARLLLLIVAAGLGARVAAMALNRLIDRRIDARNPRTAIRELPSGAMRVREGVAILLAGLAVYLAAAWAISPLLLPLAPLPLVVFLGYPYMKRFTPWAHLGVGLGMAGAPLGGYLAVTHSFQGAGPGLLLGLFTFFWGSGFDIIYATVDEEFDRAAGLHSMPAWLGRGRALRVSMALHLCAFATLAALIWVALPGALPWVFAAVVGGLLVLEHRQAARVNLAFFHVNAVLGFVVLGLVAAGVVGA